ncbi:MAG: hypothetical protein MI717_01330 [Spirochaetales bacterium]|nr:hypothetical protein [Spirochaetales bacterium]
MFPVEFALNEKQKVSPYYIAPWWNEECRSPHQVFQFLRGDFFCFPFGGNLHPYQGRQFPLHGDSPSQEWTLKTLSPGRKITLEQHQTHIPGTLQKTIEIQETQKAIYIEHQFSGISGIFPYGHHALIHLNDRACHVYHSPIQKGFTNPKAQPHSPFDGVRYSFLEGGAEFDTLGKVPSLWKHQPFVNCQKFPQSEGFGDLLLMVKEPHSQTPSFIVCLFPEQGYLWYSLASPQIFPSFQLWMENKNRAEAPWNNRNCCLGVEETCSYFGFGAAESAQKNFLNAQGIPTSHAFHAHEKYHTWNIQGVASLPQGAKELKELRFEENKRLQFIFSNGRTQVEEIQYNYVFSGDRSS